jgi:hypothetical protein
LVLGWSRLWVAFFSDVFLGVFTFAVPVWFEFLDQRFFFGFKKPLKLSSSRGNTSNHKVCVHAYSQAFRVL